jgi:hypothetical protein
MAGGLKKAAMRREGSGTVGIENHGFLYAIFIGSDAAVRYPSGFTVQIWRRFRASVAGLRALKCIGGSITQT